MKTAFLLLFLGTASAYAEEQVTCAPEQKESEIFSLLRTVKNNILGTVPRFCRPDKHEQLSDQVDPGENSLSTFYEQLKNVKTKEQDIIEFDEKNIDPIILHTIKLVALKKIWNQSTENEQFSILLSRQCRELGINRLSAFTKNSPNVSKSKKLDKNPVEMAALLCKENTFDKIVPFMTKDVLAESLLNLKIIFPDSFSKAGDKLCSNLSALDETILKDDKYSIFFIDDRSITSAKEFSSWMQETYKSIGEAIEDESPANQYKKSVKEITENYERTQKNLADLFNKAHEEDKLDTPVPHPSKAGYEIKKNSSGIFIVIVNEVAEKNLTESLVKLKDTAQYLAKKNLETTQADLGNEYEAAQKNGPKTLVPSKLHPGFEIYKNKDGKYYYKIDDATKEKIVANLKLKEIETFKKEKDAQEVPEHVKKPETQAMLKKLYVIQSKIEEEGVTGFPAIEKNTEGFYKMSSQYYQYSDILGKKKEKILKKIEYKTSSDIHFDEMTKELKDKIIPGGYTGTALAQVNNKLMTIPVAKIQNEPSPQPLPNLGYKNNINPVTVFNVVAQRKYQDKADKIKKIADASEDELIALKDYTGSSYSDINYCLRKENCNPVQRQQVSQITSFLDKIGKDEDDKNSTKILFRGLTLPKDMLDQLKNGPKNYEVDKGFMSTSARVMTAVSFSGNLGDEFQPAESKKLSQVKAGAVWVNKDMTKTLFIIKAKSCQGIDSVSYAQGEDEFLCPPGMKFNVKVKEDQENVFILEEVTK